jgi:hypothetical protein
VKPAEYLSPVEQLVSLGGEDIDTPTHTGKRLRATAIAMSEIAPKSALNGLDE